MVPPVDGKFTNGLPEQLKDLTTAELLRIYASNEAALQETASSVYALKSEIGVLKGVDVYSPEFVEQHSDTIIRMLSKTID